MSEDSSVSSKALFPFFAVSLRFSVCFWSFHPAGWGRTAHPLTVTPTLFPLPLFVAPSSPALVALSSSLLAWALPRCPHRKSASALKPP